MGNSDGFGEGRDQVVLEEGGREAVLLLLLLSHLPLLLRLLLL